MSAAPPIAARAPASASVHEALDEVRAGRPVVVVDSTARHLEPRLAIAAQFMTPAVAALMLEVGAGAVSLCLPADQARALAERTVSGPDSATGPLREAESPVELARAVQAAINPTARPHDTRPSAPLPVTSACSGGLLEGDGHAEAATDLARLAGLVPAAAVARVRHRGESLAELCAEHDLRIVTIQELRAHRRSAQRFAGPVVETRLPTTYGFFRAVGFEDLLTGSEYIALVMGEIDDARPILAVVHRRCMAGDVLHSLGCDCRATLEQAMRRIAAEGRGVLVYLSREADILAQRAIAGELLSALGIGAVRLLTADARDAEELGAELGVDVVETVALQLAGESSE